MIPASLKVLPTLCRICLPSYNTLMDVGLSLYTTTVWPPRNAPPRATAASLPWLSRDQAWTQTRAERTSQSTRSPKATVWPPSKVMKWGSPKTAQRPRLGSPSLGVPGVGAGVGGQAFLRLAVPANMKLRQPPPASAKRVVSKLDFSAKRKVTARRLWSTVWPMGHGQVTLPSCRGSTGLSQPKPTRVALNIIRPPSRVWTLTSVFSTRE
mmetsp:Transcript_57000/g.137767  ORF Transcript_57000/g.137767 Transcript_57000/m.137767 type:complete len:210 (-) Transcript_57000:654-1283(-)